MSTGFKLKTETPAHEFVFENFVLSRISLHSFSIQLNTTSMESTEHGIWCENQR